MLKNGSIREYINFDWSIMKLSRRQPTKNHIATYFCGFFHSLIAITMMRKVLKRTYRGIPKIGSVIVKQAFFFNIGRRKN